MSKIKIIWILGVLLVIAASVLLTMNKPAAPAPQTEEQPAEKAFDPKQPNFILGVVASASNDQIEFTSGPNRYFAKVNINTYLTQQKFANNKMTVASAVISDYKVGSTIVVYFSKPAEGDTYQADKIQIISQ